MSAPSDRMKPPPAKSPGPLPSSKDASASTAPKNKNWPPSADQIVPANRATPYTGTSPAVLNWPPA